MLKRALFISAAMVLVLLPGKARAASLSIEPPRGSFSVGTTFEVSVYLDTEGQSVNALDIYIQFPTDKLQVISPSTGNSVIGVWTSQPRFDNQNGIVRLQGGIPGGINVSKGLIATLTFRTRGVGDAIIRFGSDSKVLANDGSATDLLNNTESGVYDLTLPPPGGPIVTSDTHPDQTKWYLNSSVVLDWSSSFLVEAYSYILNDIPTDIPDDISEGTKNTVTYRSLKDGRYYFHIKAMRNGVWGGVTHFAIKIDTTPPAAFPVEITPSARTIRTQPVVQFTTSDALSGVERYEIKLVPLSANGDIKEESLLFFETQSPYVPSELKYGSYDVIVRAYDSVGNVREQVKRIKVVPAAFRFASDRGLEVKSDITIPWIVVWILLGVAIILLIRIARHSRAWHDAVDSALSGKIWPQHIQEQFKNLKDYKQRYGKFMPIFLLILVSLFGQPVLAQHSDVDVGPPIITTVSRDISNEEIFYVGGKIGDPGTDIIIHVQNKQTLETFNVSTQSDRIGNWFYRHGTFLTPGDYILWVQTRSGDTVSPPSPQVEMTVRQTALQFGGSRLSYEFLYLILTMIFFFVILGQTGFIALHGWRGRNKQKIFNREVKEAEEALKRGFAVLRRDIEAELSVVKRAKLSQALSEEERQKEEQLLKDLEFAEKSAGKEIWDLERLGRA